MFIIEIILFKETSKYIPYYIRSINQYPIEFLQFLVISHYLNYPLFIIRRNSLAIYLNIHYLLITRIYLPFMFRSL